VKPALHPLQSSKPKSKSDSKSTGDTCLWMHVYNLSPRPVRINLSLPGAGYAILAESIWLCVPKSLLCVPYYSLPGCPVKEFLIRGLIHNAGCHGGYDSGGAQTGSYALRRFIRTTAW